jgi:uncharacterized membrane protein YfcA
LSPDASTLAALLILAPAALIAFTIETVIGFGAIMIAGALAAYWVPTPTIVVALLPLDLVLCVVLALRQRRHIDGGFLIKRLGLAFVLGLPLGMFALGRVDPRLLRAIVGAVLVVGAAHALWRVTRRAPIERPAPMREIAALIVAGATHFTSSAGGAIAVLVAARALLCEGKYRATLFAMWAVLDVFVLLACIQGRRFDLASVMLSIALVPSCALGLVLGERVLRKVSEERLAILVFTALALTGATLIVRA